VYGLLNVLGLGLGIGCALVIFKVISFEESFDKHLSNYDNIYRIYHENIYPDGIKPGQGTPHPVGPAVREEFPDAEMVVRTQYSYGGQINVIEKDNRKKFLLDEGIAFVENDFFKLFDVTFLTGDVESALLEPNSAIITQSMAWKFFELKKGEEVKALGKTINHSNQKDFVVKGIIADPPENSNFQFTVLLNYEDQEGINPYYNKDNWGSTSSNTNTWVLVNDGFDEDSFNDRLNEMLVKHNESEAETTKFKVQPLAEVHSDSRLGNYTYTTSSSLITALYLIAIFLILTACINFINLATAQAAKRSKEIGIRKAMGGYSSQLVAQFMLEITAITFISLIVSLVISEFMFIQLEEILDNRLHIDLINVQTMVFLLGVLAIVSLLSGFYPSFLLSKLNTVKALKNKITTKDGSGKLNLRKGLVVVQFAITQFLIIGTVIVSAQMDYFMSKDLGFHKDAIVKSNLPERDEVKNKRLRELLLQNPAIENVTYSLASPTGDSNAKSNFNYAPLNSEIDYQATFKCVDENYVDLYGLEIIAGRNIRKNDSSNIVVNQKTADVLGFSDNYEEALGKKLSSGWGGRELTIVGVMKDFHSQGLSEGLEFAFLLNWPDAFYEMAFKVSTGADIDKALSHFHDSWEQVYPEYVSNWIFFDESLSSRYEQEKRIGSLMKIFSFISIIIGCLGLYGLISFISATRTKEIGIRKVLGASVLGIINRFTIEIMVLVIISFFIAAPSAYFLLSEWLNGYQFRIDVGIEFFALALLATILIAGLTISYRTISTARVNPASTLKDE